MARRGHLCPSNGKSYDDLEVITQDRCNARCHWALLRFPGQPALQSL